MFYYRAISKHCHTLRTESIMASTHTGMLSRPCGGVCGPNFFTVHYATILRLFFKRRHLLQGRERIGCNSTFAPCYPHRSTPFYERMFPHLHNTCFLRKEGARCCFPRCTRSIQCRILGGKGIPCRQTRRSLGACTSMNSVMGVWM